MNIKSFKLSNVRKGLFIIILFLVAFSINLNVINWNSIVIFGLCGTLIYYRHLKKNCFKVSIQDRYILVFIILFTVVAILSSVINQCFDYHLFTELIVLNVIRFFCAYFIIYIYRLWFGRKASFRNLIYFLALLTLFQQILAIYIFIDPSLFDVLNHFFKTSELAEEVSEGALGYRPFGLGGYRFFGAGIINCFIIISLAYILCVRKVKNLWIIVFVLLNIMGIIIARTTLVGTCVAVVMMLFNKIGRKILIKILIVIGILVIMLFLTPLSQDISYKFEVLVEFGFDLFLNYFDSGSFENKSMNKMMTMYIIPETLKTWLIGDAQLRDGDGYYMSTDIGYLRLIYCVGIIGLVVFFLYQLSILRMATIHIKEKRNLLFWGGCGLLIVTNFKGLTDMSMYLFLLYFSNKYLYQKFV